MVVVEPRVRRHGTCKADKINKPITTGSPSHVLVMAAFIYSLFLAFQTEQVLDSVDTETTDQQLAHQHQPSSPDEPHSVRDALSQLPQALKDDKFLLFESEFTGQGSGNIVSGLLSAHLMGLEFGRIVCVLPTYKQFFLEVFDAVGEEAVAKCPLILQHWTAKTQARQIQLINFVEPPNECKLQDELNSDEAVLVLKGNTYPRWPAVPDGFFFQHYRAKQVLLDALPYDPQHPPTTVVHLRASDSKRGGDPRKGLDDASLQALGETLPKGEHTYLVSNRVAYYQQFEDCCQWSHPAWNTVIHSAVGIQWGALDGSKADWSREILRKEIRRQQNLQMWADWYTVLTAQIVYHTYSDFSISAIHWMNNKNSHCIVGYNDATGTLETTAESWWVDGETAPLSQRTLEASGTSQLRLCDHVE